MKKPSKKFVSQQSVHAERERILRGLEKLRKEERRILRIYNTERVNIIKDNVLFNNCLDKVKEIITNHSL
jgi:hypothetical protein